MNYVQQSISTGQATITHLELGQCLHELFPLLYGVFFIPFGLPKIIDYWL